MITEQYLSVSSVLQVTVCTSSSATEVGRWGSSAGAGRPEGVGTGWGGPAL